MRPITFTDSRSSSTEEPPSQAPAHVIGRYALYQKVASGGMASVYLGRLLGQVGFSRTVAIKRLHPNYASDPEFVAMFLDEARLATRIRHPNVVPTLDVVALEGELFLVMEYILGESLAGLNRTLRIAGEQVPFNVAISILLGVLFGLHAAHEAKNEGGRPLHIVHRDVSPQNILVGVDGVARVLDFGVAKAVGRMQTTREGQVKGKLSYMAPEQITSSHVDLRADIFSASVVLWEVLVGRRLFAGENAGAIIHKILANDIPAPSHLNPAVPQALDDIVLRGLAHNREERFASAREMALALEQTVMPATSREVGEWVEQVAGQAVQSRAESLAEVESFSSSAKLSLHSLDDFFARPNPTPGKTPALALVPPAETLRPGGSSSEAPTKAEAPPSSDVTDLSAAAHLTGVSRTTRYRWAVAFGALTLLTGITVFAMHSKGHEDKNMPNTGAAPSSSSGVASSIPGSSEGATPEEPSSGSHAAALNPAPPSAEPETEPLSAGSTPLSVPLAHHVLTRSKARASTSTSSPTGSTTSGVNQPPKNEPASAPRSCENPFVIDKDGVRRPRSECF